jgi:hypothetical protein
LLRLSIRPFKGGEAPGVRASEDPLGLGNVLEVLVGYMTLQFFGFGASIRIPSSVVFVGTMNVT